MIKVDLFLGVVSLALCIYCVIEAIMTDTALVRNLPKAVWILLILFFPLVGSIAWLVAGRPATRTDPPASAFPEYDRPGRAAGVTQESDEEFLRRTRERAEEQRRRYEEQKRREAEGDQPDPGGG
ncbi:MAG: PLD nuclease N-terminal domain-containing protein [Nocardioidaceae bacterium]